MKILAKFSVRFILNYSPVLDMARDTPALLKISWGLYFVTMELLVS